MVNSQGEWDSALDNYEAAYAFPDFNPNNFSDGLFYNSFALTDERGLGYYGWRMPSLADATILNDFINADYPGEKAWTLKSTTSWTTANGTDRYGFNAKGLGEKDGTNEVRLRRRGGHSWRGACHWFHETRGCRSTFHSSCM